MAPVERDAVSDRGIVKLKRIIKSLGEEIKSIRNKGFSAVSSSSDRNLFRGMFATIDKLYGSFEEKWEDAIEYCEQRGIDPPFPQPDDEVYLKEVKTYYYEIQSYNVQISAKVNSPVRASISPNDASIAANHSRAILPKIPIKQFRGDWTQWPTFKQLFTSLIIEENSLTDTERFHYLISYLEGQAYDAIKHVAVVGENFNQAWAALLKVYDDKRKLACTYLEKFLNFKPPTGKPTVDTLQAYLSGVTESIASLKNLEITNFSDYLLCELALRSLDPMTREAFEISIVGTPFPTFSELQTFVQGRCQVLRITQESTSKLEFSKPQSKSFKPPNRYGSRQSPRQALMAHTGGPTSRSSSSTSSPQHRTCFICKQDHMIAMCPRFKSSTPSQRLDLLRRFEGCRNCLYPFHKTRDCPSSFTCRECNARHHSDLHLPTTSSPSNTSRGSSDPSPSAPLSLPNQTLSAAASSNGFAGTNTTGRASVLLGTIVALLRDAQGRSQSFRGVVDPGSQFSFVTEECARQLKKSTRPFRGVISGVNHSPLQNVKGQINVRFTPRTLSKDLQTEAIVVPSITPPLPQAPLHSTMWDDYSSYDLSDPAFATPGPISFLLGADLYPDIVSGVPIVIHDDGPRLIQTVFGYVVIGRFMEEGVGCKAVSLMAHSDLAPLIERFWEIEEPVFPALASPEDERCEQIFQATHHRTDGGRYVVSLPFKSDSPRIVPNTSRALNCLYSLEARLAKNESLRADYCAQLEEYLELGHMSLATSPPAYVIPHHAVFKDEGEKRKLRVVFDGSFPTSTGSLNDHLLTGPKLQADITVILLNFRRHTYVFSCDIVKMFRQVLLDPAHRCYQQIAWRSNTSDPVQFYELNTVTFGLSCSPYLAQRVLRQHALNYQNQYPEASAVLLNNTYIDDIVAGSDSPDHLLMLKSQLIELLDKGGFELGKWTSNYPPILEHHELTQQPVVLCSEGDKSVTKILGMRWDPRLDVFSYDVSSPPQEITKRAILSTVARLYDPLGYLAPIIFYAKCVLQHTWQMKLGWDEAVPCSIQRPWLQFIEELPSLSSISIPRAFPKTDKDHQFVCFADASSKGYCASIYLRSTQDSRSTLTLLKSKTKLAPLKTLTIPRLELCGALLLSQLLHSLEHLKGDLDVHDVFCFTDSSTVLAWINTQPHMLQTFVSNRVQQVLALTKLEWWHHIKGSENPADVGSRGTSPAQLKDHHLWWNGPSWCQLPINQWPVSTSIPNIEIPELKQTKLALVSVKTSLSLVEYCGRHSSFPRFVRIIAYLKRFIANSRIPKAMSRCRASGPISAQEFREANAHYIKLLQHSYFPQVYTEPSFNQLSLELRRLNVFIDHEGLIRVGGRLSHAPLSLEHKHPILLPDRSFYTNLVVNHFHNQNHHAGPSALLAALRQQYWIPKLKNLIKHLKHKCVVCTRFSKANVVPYMGNLPKSRFASVRPFLITGVDFAGPFLYRISSTRKSSVDKAYLCLFLCMSSRALHLEVALSLSVEGFLDAFDRFASRRGLPTQMLSDGGTNFHGTNHYLQDVKRFLESDNTQSSFIEHTNHLGVKWNFNPPSSPHFGGGWEVSVRLVKELLYQTFGHQPFTLPELNTIFVKIEGILNSRPILPLSSSPEDLEPLTPGHFLIGQPITTHPEPDFSDIPPSKLNRWQLLRERIQFFWQRWKEEYLSGLQRRQKWQEKAPNLKPDDLVLLLETNSSPTHWPLGRILEVHPGQDGVVRVVTIRTSKGIYKRPAIKMIPLKLEDIHQ